MNLKAPKESLIAPFEVIGVGLMNDWITTELWLYRIDDCLCHEVWRRRRATTRWKKAEKGRNVKLLDETHRALSNSYRSHRSLRDRAEHVHKSHILAISMPQNISQISLGHVRRAIVGRRRQACDMRPRHISISANSHTASVLMQPAIVRQAFCVAFRAQKADFCRTPLLSNSIFATPITIQGR